MSCYRPLTAHRDRLTGAVTLGQGGSATGDRLELPCGRCIGCKMARARAWSIRITHEAQLYDRNLFLTLDYAPEHLNSWSLQYRDFQAFMKRLRKRFRGHQSGPNGRHPIRFFVAGEYGSTYKRPHFHAILFNVSLSDRRQFANGSARSDTMDEVWGKGNVHIGDVTPQSAAYVAGYTLAKKHGREALDHYEDLVDPTTGEISSRRPEFVCMSRRPGIGSWWYDRFKGDLFPHDAAVQDGKKHTVPRYYSQKFRQENPQAWEAIEHERFLRAMQFPREERTEARRATREEFEHRKMQFFGQRSH